MSTFDETIRHKHEQYSEFWGSPCSEQYYTYTCPFFNNDDIVEQEPPKCSCCGDYCVEEYVETANGYFFCNNCYQIKDLKN